MGILLKEIADEKSVEIIKEDVDINGKKEQRYKIRGPYMTAESLNKNGRIYPRDVLSEAIDVYKKDWISQGRALGELEHGSTPNITPERCVICIESLGFKDEKDNNVYGIARLLDENYFPLVKIVRGMISEGIKMGISSRAVGELDDNNRVKKGLVIASVDLVMNPSNAASIVEAFVESKQWFLDGDKFVERAVTNLKQKMDKKYSSELAKQYLINFIEDLQIGSRNIL